MSPMVSFGIPRHNSFIVNKLLVAKKSLFTVILLGTVKNVTSF